MLLLIMCPTVVGQPCLSPFSQSHPLPSYLQSTVNVAVSPIGDSSNQISDSCCLCPSLGSSKPWHFLLYLGKPMPLAHLHSLEWQTPGSCQHRQAWSILGTLRTKDWGVCVSWWALLLWEIKAWINPPVHRRKTTCAFGFF